VHRGHARGLAHPDPFVERGDQLDSTAPRSITRRVPREVSFSTEGPSEGEGEENIKDKDDAASAQVEAFGRCVGKTDSDDDFVGTLGRGQCMWQWRHTKGGFRNYSPTQNDQIEEAYRRGQSKMRFKSGQDGQTVMEMFFAGMVQLDPKSRNIRQVRRIDPKVWYFERGRRVQAMARSIFKSRLRWESYERYRKRQHALLGIGEGEVESCVSSSHFAGGSAHRVLLNSRILTKPTMSAQGSLRAQPFCRSRCLSRCRTWCGSGSARNLASSTRICGIGATSLL